MLNYFLIAVLMLCCKSIEKLPFLCFNSPCSLTRRDPSSVLVSMVALYNMCHLPVFLCNAHEGWAVWLTLCSVTTRVSVKICICWSLSKVHLFPNKQIDLCFPDAVPVVISTSTTYLGMAEEFSDILERWRMWNFHIQSIFELSKLYCHLAKTLLVCRTVAEDFLIRCLCRYSIDFWGSGFAGWNVCISPWMYGCCLCRPEAGLFVTQLFAAGAHPSCISSAAALTNSRLLKCVQELKFHLRGSFQILGSVRTLGEWGIFLAFQCALIEPCRYTGIVCNSQCHGEVSENRRGWFALTFWVYPSAGEL